MGRPVFTSSCSWMPTATMLAAPLQASESVAGGGRVPIPRGSFCASSLSGCIWWDCSVRSGSPRWILGSLSRAAAEPAGRGWRGVTRREVLASDMGEDEEVGCSRCFLRARNGGELLYCIRNKVDAGKLSSDIATRLEELYYNYHNAVMQSGDPSASEIILSNMAVVFDRILLDIEDPFTFSAYHKAIREPFDYYMFGQNYFRPLIDFRNSYVGNLPLFSDMEEKLKQGHNIILFSNHQTEGDPALIALLLERTNAYLAEKMVFVAGDRVVTDPLCKPFSMGRNLICVYSKKHMHDHPELVEMKRRANTRSLKEMALLLRGGSQIIWIAPSGGRDRPEPLTGEWHPAPFDESSVDNMRRLVEHSGVVGHMYPLSLLCYEIMPPPPQVEKQIGERRRISFHGIGLSAASEMKFEVIAAGCENPEQAKGAYSQALYNSVVAQYNVLKSAIYGYQGLDASNSIVSLSQPWFFDRHFHKSAAGYFCKVKPLDTVTFRFLRHSAASNCLLHLIRHTHGGALMQTSSKRGFFFLAYLLCNGLRKKLPNHWQGS